MVGARATALYIELIPVEVNGRESNELPVLLITEAWPLCSPNVMSLM